MITKENYHRTNAANLKPDNIDINRHPVHVGYVNYFISSKLNNNNTFFYIFFSIKKIMSLDINLKKYLKTCDK